MALPDANELARQMAADQRRDTAERKARADAAERTAMSALQNEVRELGRSVYAQLEARNFPDMQPIVLTWYNSFLGERRKDAAGWEIARFRRGWKDAEIEETVWLLAQGEFGVGKRYGVHKHTVDDPFLCQFLTDVLSGLRAFAERLA
jgi:uncharacterized Zn finger protein